MIDAAVDGLDALDVLHNSVVVLKASFTGST
jgi:hypothetical protein